MREPCLHQAAQGWCEDCLSRLEAAAREDAIEQFSRERKWMLLERAEKECTAARLAGRLEQAELALHMDNHETRLEERDRLRREVEAK